MEQFDFNQFVMTGFSEVELDRSFLEALRPVVANQDWVDAASEDGLQEADWCHSGRYVQKNIVIPDAYKPFLDYIDTLTRRFFGENVQRDIVSLWLGGEELDWHEHITDREVEDLHWLIYLGSNEWHPDAGGLLLLKNAQLPDIIHTIVPTYGTAVVLNNSNQTYLHKVTKFTPLSTRIVLQVGYYFPRQEQKHR